MDMTSNNTQARRQEYPEGAGVVDSQRESHLALRVTIMAGDPGAAQGPRNPGAFGAKSYNLVIFQALHSNFRKVRFSETDC